MWGWVLRGVGASSFYVPGLRPLELLNDFGTFLIHCRSVFGRSRDDFESFSDDFSTSKKGRIHDR